MATGQSVVLYSRLHLVVHNAQTMRLVLTMIIISAIICHVLIRTLICRCAGSWLEKTSNSCIQITVFAYGANSNFPDRFTIPYSIYEKVQITIFFFQETAISGLYVFHTKLLELPRNINGKAVRDAMTHLIHINLVIVLLDLSVLGVE